MGFVFSLAMKNLLRYKRRTFLTAIAIAAGLAVYIWVDAFVMGIELESQRNMMWYETGSAQVLDAAYFSERDYFPLKYAIEKPDKILALLKENKVAATKRITFGGELFFYPAEQETNSLTDDQTDRSRTLKFFAIDMATVSDVLRINAVLVDKQQTLQEGQDSILLGSELARDMQIQVGNTVQVRTRSRFGNEVVIELTVSGLINCPNPVVNKAVGFVSLATAEKNLDMEGAVTDIPVLFPEWKNTANEVKKISALLAANYQGLDVKDWNDMSGNIMYAQSKKKFIGLMLFLVAVIAAVGITNTMLMAVFERMREIGMMRALGMKDKDIRLAFLFEAGGIGIIGSLGGLIFGFMLTFISVYWGIDFSQFIGDMDIGYRVYGVVHGSWNPQTMVSSVVFGVLASTLVALYPASRALHINITDCLRHQ